MWDVLQVNLASPLALAFVLGIVSRLLKSELSLPRDLYASLSIYLLLALGLKGGVELSQTSLNALFWPAVVTVGLGLFTPVSAYLVLRRLGRFPIADAAGIAAHYGSVSAVTFIAAQQFVQTMNQPAEGFLPTLLTLLEIPGIQLALAIGAIQMARERAAQQAGQSAAEAPRPMAEVLHEVLTSRSMILMVGGLIIGCLMGEQGYEPVKPFFEGMFKGALTLFLLEMGLAAGARLGDLKSVGLFLLGFGMILPVLHGGLGVLLGHWSGLSIGGAAVLGTMAASASYIAAPPAVRITLPEANPTYYLTAALAITFPFNIVLGIPQYYQMATLLAAH
ncbi:MAG: sodium-dependent bicarbonate transport family permease [Planctomycetaceae bacterium]